MRSERESCFECTHKNVCKLIVFADCGTGCSGNSFKRRNLSGDDTFRADVRCLMDYMDGMTLTPEFKKLVDKVRRHLAEGEEK